MIAPRKDVFKELAKKIENAEGVDLLIASSDEIFEARSKNELNHIQMRQLMDEICLKSENVKVEMRPGKPVAIFTSEAIVFPVIRFMGCYLKLNGYCSAFFPLDEENITREAPLSSPVTVVSLNIIHHVSVLARYQRLLKSHSKIILIGGASNIMTPHNRRILSSCQVVENPQQILEALKKAHEN